MSHSSEKRWGEVGGEEIAKAADVVTPMIAVHELWQAANNVAVTAAQRAQFMRRMI